MCECVCQICKEPSKVEHNCDCTPPDMTWCEGPSHKDYSKLIHVDCGFYIKNEYDDTELVCVECFGLNSGK